MNKYTINVTINDSGSGGRLYEQLTINQCDFVTMCQVVEAIQFFKKQVEKEQSK